jgi:hypothetical protein
MAKYRKRPVVVDAFQWNGEECPPYGRICVGKDELGVNHYNLVIPTLEGTMYATEGDYIIIGVKNEVYPCKVDIFEMTYEIVWDEDK